MSSEIYFERSIFTNWTCALADCTYCYLSTKPKHNPAQSTTATRSMASILSEVLLCREMGWRVGYITGGIGVEKPKYLIQLLKNIKTILGYKIMMNYGPYPNHLIAKFAPYLNGMGSAIESFDEKLHNSICPSKPLSQLLTFLENLEKNNLKKLITIILGLGETINDTKIVIENIKKYNIDQIQLCFLKPQAGTPFAKIDPLDPEYMASWISKLRLELPQLIIKVALVNERIEDLSLYLKAGANNFSRFMIFKEFGTPIAKKLVSQCHISGRKLKGEFCKVPNKPWEKIVDTLPFPNELRKSIYEKLIQYINSLEKCSNRLNTLSSK